VIGRLKIRKLHHLYVFPYFNIATECVFMSYEYDFGLIIGGGCTDS